MLLPPLPRERILHLFSSITNLDHAKQIHAQLVVNFMTTQTALSIELAKAYFSFSGGVSDHARFHLVFSVLADASRSSRALTEIIRSSPAREVLDFYAAAQTLADVKIDRLTSIYALRACARLETIRTGIQIHARILKLGFSLDLAASTAGIYFYGRCKDIVSAMKLFDEMPHRNSPSWNSMIKAFCDHNQPVEALKLFKEMLREEEEDNEKEALKPTERTGSLLLLASATLANLDIGKAIHSFILKAIPENKNDLFLCTGLIDMYSKCGCLTSARQVFQRMPKKNIHAWTAMSAGLAIHGEVLKALESLHQMHKDGMNPNAVTFASLLAACCRSGMVESGLRMFEEMNRRFGIPPGAVHYTCLVDLLARSGMMEEAHNIIEAIPKEAAADGAAKRALMAAFRIHGQSGVVKEIEKIRVLAGKPEEREDYMALSNFYASTGNWEGVVLVREAMRLRGVQNRPGCSSVPGVELGTAISTRQSRTGTVSQLSRPYPTEG